MEPGLKWAQLRPAKELLFIGQWILLLSDLAVLEIYITEVETRRQVKKKKKLCFEGNIEPQFQHIKVGLTVEAIK